MAEPVLLSISREIQNLKCEIISDKIATRHKAIEKLDGLLNSSEAQLVKICSNHEIYDLKWSELYSNAVDSILKQCQKLEDSRDAKGFQTLKNKNPIYSAVATKIVSYSNKSPKNKRLSPVHIYQSITLIFDNRIAKEFFGSTFLEIIEVSFLSSTNFHNISELKPNDMVQIIDYVIKAAKNFERSQKLALKITSIALESAIKYFPINQSYVNYLVYVKEFTILAESKRDILDVVIKINYIMIKTLSVDFHKRICEYLQNDIMLQLCKFYDYRMRTSSKELLFEIFELFLVIHYPNLKLKGNLTPINNEFSNELSKKYIRSLKDIINKEIKENILARDTINLSGHFLEFSSSVLYLIYYLDLRNPIILQNELTDDHCQRRKISKKSHRMEIIIDFIKESPLTTTLWFSIFVKLLSYLPFLIEIENFSSLIELNTKIVNDYFTNETLQQNEKKLLYILENIKVFTEILLNSECRFYQKDSMSAVESFKPFWKNFSETIISQNFEVSTETEIERNLILSNLFKFEKIELSSVDNLLNNYVTKNPEKLKRLDILMMLREIFNLNKTNVQKFTHLTKLLEILYSPQGDKFLTDEKSFEILTEITVTLVLNNFDIRRKTYNKNETNSNSSGLRNLNNEHDNEHYKNSRIIKMIELKYLQRVINIKKKDVKSDTQYFENVSQMKTSVNYLNEANFKLLIEHLNYQPSVNLTEMLKKLQKIILLNLKFTELNVINCNTEICPIRKKFQLLFDQFELQLKDVNINELQLPELFDIFQNILFTLKLIIHHQNPLSENLNEVNFVNIINFITECSKKEFQNHECDEDDNRDKKELIENLEYLSIEIFAILTLAFKNDRAFKIIKKYDFKKKNISIIFKIFKYFSQCDAKEVQKNHAEWILEQLKILCQQYNLHNDVNKKIIDILPGIFLTMSSYADLTEDLFIIISLFQKLCYKLKMSEEFIANLLLQLKYICELQPNKLFENDSVNQLYLAIGKFFNHSSLLVQFTVIECVSFLLNPIWVLQNSNNFIISAEYYKFSQDLYTSINWQKILNEEEDLNDVDTNQNINSTSVQLFLQLYSFSYIGRKIGFLELTEFIKSRNSFDELSISKILDHIAKNFNCQLEFLSSDLLEVFISQLLTQNIPLKQLPWYIFGKIEMSFYEDNKNLLRFCALKSSPEKFAEFEKKYVGNNKQLDPIIQMALGFICPYFLKIMPIKSEMLLVYEHECKVIIGNLQKITQEKFTIIEFNRYFEKLKISKWLLTLTKLTFDDNQFSKLIGFKLYVNNLAVSFNIDQFRNCLERNLNPTRSVDSAFLKLIEEHPIELIDYLNNLKKTFYKSFFLNEKLLNLSKCLMAIDLISESLTSRADTFTSNLSLKYFAKDILNFLEKSLKKFIKMDLICYALLNFLEKILIDWIHLPEIESFYMKTIFTIIEFTEKKTQKQSTLRSKGLTVLENVFCQVIEKSQIYLSLIEPLMEKEIFYGTNVAKAKIIHIADEMESIQFYVNEFLATPNVDKIPILSQVLTEKKSELFKMTADYYSLNKLSKLIKYLTNIMITENSLKAAECLGKIGPICMQKYSFVPIIDTIYEETNTTVLENFVNCVTDSIENRLFDDDYDSEIVEILHTLCELLANSEYFKKYTTKVPYLAPFIQLSNTKFPSCDFSIHLTMNVTKILRDFENFEYKKFLCHLTGTIFQHMKANEFAQLAYVSFEFSQSILLPLVKLMLRNSSEFKKNLIDLLEVFFELSVESILCPFSKKIYKNKQIIKCFLDFCECLRLQNNWCVPINLLNVAKVSTYQQAHFLAILYLEMWATGEQAKTNFTKNITEIRENSIEFQKIAAAAFQSIGCTTAVNCFLNPIESRLDYHNNSNDIMDILIELDATNSIQKSNLLIENLKRNGLISFSNSLNELKPVDYEICWRLAQWDTPLEQQDDDREMEKFSDSLKYYEFKFEKLNFQALKSIYEKDQTTALRAIKMARQNIIEIFKEISIESVQKLYKYLTDLMLINQTEDFLRLQIPVAVSTTTDQLDLILKNWNNEKKMQFGNFQNKERILAQRIILFESAGVRASRKIKEFYNDENIISSTLIYLIDECNRNSNLNLTKRYLTKLKSLNHISPEILASAKYQDAQICWQTDRKIIGRKILQNMMNMKESNLILHRIEAVHLYGLYTAEASDEHFDDIRQKYFLESIKMTKKVEELLRLKKITLNCKNFDEFIFQMKKKNYAAIAKYADREYLQIDNHIKSDSFQKTIRLKEKNLQDVEKIEKKRKKAYDRDIQFTHILLTRNSKIDQDEIEHFKKKHSEYLLIAIENYIKFSEVDENIQSPSIYRLISLWLSNKESNDLNELLETFLSKVPTFKFICVLNQLTAHLNNGNSNFINILEKLLIKMAVDHPHHVLCHIISLINADADSIDATTAASNKEKDLRIQLAKRIITKIRNKNDFSEIIEQLERMSLALIEFANVNAKRTVKISEKIKKLNNLDRIQCPTKILEIQKNKSYQIVSIRKWIENVVMVGGVNAPKKITCQCSDGVTYPQLLKGNDDLRQDAVMQQIFSFANELLRHKKEISDLSLRTYKIVPLSKRSGLLEWCLNTIPIGEYLCGPRKDKGAHAKYRPNDITLLECRNLLDKHPHNKSEERFKVFKEICNRFHPVFQYFFFEKFHSPGVWFEKRLAYMNSVAVSSIVGFVVGLGDRHVQNILIDQETAEVIHIDFGIAFEQGKIMPTPETVPFRLTRDIVAPMGVCQVDGVFRDTCEETMKILRENQQVLLTILEVLLYDPLYCWTLNPKVIGDTSANKPAIDSEDQEYKNATAQRALIRIQSKLEGRENMQTGCLSVESHVQKLISEAMSFKNLCRLYKGWDPYL